MADRFLDFDFTTGTKILKTPIATSSGSADAGKMVRTNSDGVIDITLLPSNIGAESFTVIAGENLAANDLIYLYDDNGIRKCKKAIATNENTLAKGYVTTSASAGSEVTVYTSGYITSSGLDYSKSSVYLSATTAGAVTQTAPSGSGQWVQIVGSPLAADKFKFEIIDFFKVQ